MTMPVNPSDVDNPSNVPPEDTTPVVTEMAPPGNGPAPSETTYATPGDAAPNVQPPAPVSSSVVPGADQVGTTTVAPPVEVGDATPPSGPLAPVAQSTPADTVPSTVVIGVTHTVASDGKLVPINTGNADRTPVEDKPSEPVVTEHPTHSFAPSVSVSAEGVVVNLPQVSNAAPPPKISTRPTFENVVGSPVIDGVLYLVYADGEVVKATMPD